VPTCDITKKNTAHVFEQYRVVGFIGLSRTKLQHYSGTAMHFAI